MSPTQFFWLVSSLFLPDVFSQAFVIMKWSHCTHGIIKKKKKGFEKFFLLRSAISLTLRSYFSQLCFKLLTYLHLRTDCLKVLQHLNF